ncbi:oxidoreductase [Variovorax sp. OV329]|uniref:oxidoreductase n=1 Tax=Variovorax sp. OV329 TaxID=1882825 RepID=UPI0008F085BB|nr:oxidoreductase [Variovorax sp. OV329]SFN18984.1 scyllo-inositol 2-dehydrogenase (NADP+) [Variovorax sp. OV329]
MPTQPPLRVGLVGYGFAGQTFHAPVLSVVPGLQLAAVASSQADKVLADWPGAAIVPDVEALMAADLAIDLVVVATPNEAHFPVAKAALAAGRHVVVDKPFTLDAAQASELADLARSRRKIVSVYQNRRFDSDFLTLRQVLAEGRVGRPVFFESHFDRYRPDVRVRWREQKVPGAGLWVDLGAHLMDQAVQLFGKPDTLQLDTAALREGALVEDYFHAVLRWEQGPHAPLRAVLHATTLAADPAPRYILHGTRGSYVKYGVDPQEDALRTGARPGGEGWGVDPEDGSLTLIGDSGQPEAGTVPTLAGDYTRYYAAVRDAIAGTGPAPVTPEQAVQLMELLDLGRRSAEEGRALPT